MTWLTDLLGLNQRNASDVELVRRATLRWKGDVTIEDKPAEGLTEVTIAPGSGGSSTHTALSVLGRAGGTDGVAADIASSANDTFFRRVAGALGWGGLTIGMIADGLITGAKLDNLTVTGAKIAAATITADKIAASVLDLSYVTESGTSITLSSATHKRKTVLCTSNSAIAITYPAQADDDMGEGALIEIIPMGTGQITIAGNGFTILSEGGKLKSSGRYGSLFVKKLPGTNQVQATGALTT